MGSPLYYFCALCFCLQAFLVAGQVDSLEKIILVEPVSEPGSDVTGTESDVSFNVEHPFKIPEGQHMEVSFFTTLEDAYEIKISFKEEGIATFTQFEYQLVSNSEDVPTYEHLNTTDKESVTAFGKFNVTGIFLGYSAANITIYDVNQKMIGIGTLPVGILLAKQLWTQIFSIVFAITLIMMFFEMGSTLDLEIIKQIMKKPIGPVIGLVCQYGAMPTIAYLLGLWAFPDNNLYRLGLLASGCAPGGGLSNMWTKFLGGSLDLSVMMTFVSTVASLGMVPLWLLTVGQSILSGEYSIPYGNIITGLILLVVPVFLGIGAQMKFLKATTTINKVVRPAWFVGFLISMGLCIYANLFTFSLMTWEVVLVAFGLSFFGYLAGIIMALLFRRSVKEVIAISIETAVQNNSVGYFFLINSIDRPAGDLAAVIPMSVFFLNPPPVILAIIIKKLYEYYKKSKTATIEEQPKIPSKEVNQRRDGKDRLQQQPPGYQNYAYANDP